MVALADVNRAAGLAGESRRLDRAIAAFAAEGFAIVQMTVAPDMLTIDTGGMEYPPVMKEAILAMLTARKDAVDTELTELGVTGIETRR